MQSVRDDFLVVNGVLAYKKISVIKAVVANDKGPHLSAQKANVFSVVISAQVRPFHQRIILASRVSELGVCGRQKCRNKKECGNSEKNRANKFLHIEIIGRTANEMSYQKSNDAIFNIVSMTFE